MCFICIIYIYELHKVTVPVLLHNTVIVTCQQQITRVVLCSLPQNLPCTVYKIPSIPPPHCWCIIFLSIEQVPRNMSVIYGNWNYRRYWKAFTNPTHRSFSCFGGELTVFWEWAWNLWWQCRCYISHRWWHLSWCTKLTVISVCKIKGHLDLILLKSWFTRLIRTSAIQVFARGKQT